jgi:outer membrane protein OmpA-like peptidoglycan-associated protein
MRALASPTTAPRSSRRTHGFPVAVRDVLRTPGQELEPTARAAMESRFGQDFSRVRVHADEHAGNSARSVGALAYTVGDHLVFQPNRYAPGSLAGRRLLAHELTHTLQQRRGASAGPLVSAQTSNDALEREADQSYRATHSARNDMPGTISAAAPQVQRACGRAVIGLVGGCIGRGGDITDYAASSDRVFRFEPGCDDFKPNEKERLEELARTLSSSDAVVVDGFASEEGNTDFNTELSCARAHAAANVLLRQGVSPTNLYNHGATPGARPDRRSAVISTRAGDTTPAPEESTGPDATPDDCTRDQITMLNNHLNDARRWVNDATRKVTDYAYVSSSSRHSAVPASTAEAAVVERALDDNFHTRSAGHVLQIRDGFQELRSALAGSFTFECEGGCDGPELAYVRGAVALVRQLGDVHACPAWFTCRNYFVRVGALIHERAHQHPGATDHFYEWQAGYSTLSADDAIDNADSFTVAARQIYHGGAHGPGGEPPC